MSRYGSPSDVDDHDDRNPPRRVVEAHCADCGAEVELDDEPLGRVLCPDCRQKLDPPRLDYFRFAVRNARAEFLRDARTRQVS